MLYEGSIRFLQQAMEAMEQNDPALRYGKLTHAGEIILALQSALDLLHGGPQAKALFEFYAGIDTRILALHRGNNVEACAEVIADLRNMRDVWDGIDKNVKSAS